MGPSRTDDIHAGIATARAAIAARLRYDDHLFDLAPDLVAVSRTGIGCDAIDLEAATRRGVAVCNVPDGPTVSTAEHSVALMLAVAKRVIQSGNRLRNARGDYYASHSAVELAGRTLGLVGFGRIARRVAAIGSGIGMDILAYDPYLSDTDFPAPVTRAALLPGLLARSDVVSLHVPLTPGTARMFSADAFATMKPRCS